MKLKGVLHRGNRVALVLYSPVEEIIETLILRDVGLLELVEGDGVGLDEGGDGLDGFWRIVHFALLNRGES